MSQIKNKIFVANLERFDHLVVQVEMMSSKCRGIVRSIIESGGSVRTLQLWIKRCRLHVDGFTFPLLARKSMVLLLRSGVDYGQTPFQIPAPHTSVWGCWI